MLYPSPKSTGTLISLFSEQTIVSTKECFLSIQIFMFSSFMNVISPLLSIASLLFHDGQSKDVFFEGFQDQRDMQNVLMHRFYELLSLSFVQEISYGKSHADVCSGDGRGSWFGIACFEGRVEVVHYNQLSKGNFQIEFLPQCVEMIIITECQQCYALDTRSLPQNLRDLNFSSNKLYGSLNLRCLPGHLYRLNVRNNKFTGAVTTRFLPDTLALLNMRGNKVKVKNGPIESHDGEAKGGEELKLLL